MKPVVVASVERAGTHFAAWLVGNLLHKKPAWIVPSTANEITKENVGVLVTHVYPEGFRSHSDAVVAALVEHSTLDVVVPVRHPLRVLISKRERTEDACTSLVAAEALVRITDWDKLGVHYLKVDAHGDEITEEINWLAEYLGADSRNPGWEPKNEAPPSIHSETRKRFDAGRDVTCEFPAEMAVLEPVRAFYEGFGYVW